MLRRGRELSARLEASLAHDRNLHRVAAVNIRQPANTDSVRSDSCVASGERMREWIYGSDGELRCEAAVIGRVEAGGEGAFAHMVVGDRAFDIVQRSGWHFVVLAAPSGTPICECVPFRMRRGGRLRIGNSETRLRAILLPFRRWRFDSDHGKPLVAVVARGEAQSQSGTRPIAVRMRAEEWMRHNANAPLLLTFGCWLITQWESVVVQGPGGSPILLGGG